MAHSERVGTTYQDSPGIGGFLIASDYKSTLSLSVSQHISLSHHLHSFIHSASVAVLLGLLGIHPAFFISFRILLFLRE